MNAYGMWSGNVLREIDGVSFKEFSISTEDIKNLRQQNINLAEQNAELKEQLFNTVNQLSQMMITNGQQYETLKSLDQYIEEKLGKPQAAPGDSVLEIAYVMGATRVIGQEQGYQGLPVFDTVFDCPVNGPGTPLMITAWLPNEEQVEKLKRGAAISVQILGTDHPPLLVCVGEPVL